jgi:colicin import membrane protein
MTTESETSDLPAAAIGHNSIPAGEMVEADPSVIYREKGVLEALLAEVDASIEEHPKDLTTEKGRKAIASLAASIARKKGPIVDAGLTLTEGWRKQTAAVNLIKKYVETEFDKRRDLARKPLDEWETKDKERRDRIAGVIDQIDALGNIPPGATVENIEDSLAALKTIDITEADFGEFAARAQASWRKAHGLLTDARDRAEQADKERKELEELRAEKAQRDQEEQDREDKLAAEAAEQQRIADAATEAADKVRREAQSEIDDAKKRADDAQRELDRIKEENDKAEKDRLAAKAKADKEEADRAADQEHRSLIMRAATEAIIEHGGIGEDRAKKIVLAIAAGSVPHTSIKF